VTLIDKVTRPTLKSDAKKVVRQIEGIGTVRNQIRVLPFSASDDRLRLSLYRAIYGNSSTSAAGYPLRSSDSHPRLERTRDHGCGCGEFLAEIDG